MQQQLATNLPGYFFYLLQGTGRVIKIYKCSRPSRFVLHKVWIGVKQSLNFELYYAIVSFKIMASLLLLYTQFTG